MGVPTLVVTGPVGVGKTSTAHEIGGRLARAGVPHAVVDLDALASSYPPPPNDPFNARMAYRNLASVWANYAAAGAERLVVAYVIEARDELEPLRAAVPGAEIVVVRLRAADETLRARVTGRDHGASRAWHLHRAVELARLMDDRAVEQHLVETDRRPLGDVADEVLRKVGWL
jgi:hypothetical protein